MTVISDFFSPHHGSSVFFALGLYPFFDLCERHPNRCELRHSGQALTQGDVPALGYLVWEV